MKTQRPNWTQPLWLRPPWNRFICLFKLLSISLPLQKFKSLTINPNIQFENRNEINKNNKLDWILGSKQTIHRFFLFYLVFFFKVKKQQLFLLLRLLRVVMETHASKLNKASAEYPTCTKMLHNINHTCPSTRVCGYITDVDKLHT